MVSRSVLAARPSPQNAGCGVVGAATLTNAIDALIAEGFTEHFAVEGGQLRGLESEQLFNQNDVVIRRFVRFEGISDPDDMAIVYAIETCTGLRGTLTDAFGVYSNPVISAFVDQVQFRA